jgi:hypothetical protein
MMHAMSDLATIVVPLATAAIAGAAAIGGAIYGSRREHKHWLRTERTRAYVALMNAADTFLAEAIRMPGARFMTQLDVMRQAQLTIEVLGPINLIPRAQALVTAARNAADADLISDDGREKARAAVDDHLKARTEFANHARESLT